ncbi:hypothetical protein [Klebsiella oxytoca]|nr:hypothetical protein [Klebsiella oxytoca]ELG4819609.1 hypothetical protein [Klebsiella oxytoca]ELK5563551.1 hypothetical protein [Klebsiella oxytoca]MCY3426932.1 hypothetical protein [Klebsiella oxytoca]MDM4081045.1 hypothetical protein [Klebsiella oxytoca]MDM4098549.1 hypothetical protein [Klebsiella oxytoca]
MNVLSPVALTLTGATALRGMVARTRRVKRRLRETTSREAAAISPVAANA